MALMYEEDTKYRTEVGSVLTMILLITVLTFMATKVRVLVSQDSDQKYYQCVSRFCKPRKKSFHNSIVTVVCQPG